MASSSVILPGPLPMKSNLLFASLAGPHEKARELIEQGAALDVQDSCGWTALMYACARDQRETARLLVQNGAMLDLQNTDGLSALMVACARSQAASAKVLAENGANLDLQDKEGWTAIMIACKKKEKDIVMMLVEKGANLDLKDNGGWTALMFACANEETEIAKVLVQNGASLDLQDYQGWNAMMCACLWCKDDVVQLLAQNGAKLDLQNKKGWTALMVACLSAPQNVEAVARWTAEGALKCLKVCYAAGANMGLKDSDGDDALAKARKVGDPSRVEFIEFVLFTKLEKVLEEEQKVSREAIVRLFENKVPTLDDCNELSKNQLQQPGEEERIARKTCLRRLRANKKNPRASLRKSISMRLGAVLPSSKCKFDAFLVHDWEEDGSTHQIVSEINQYLHRENKLTWFQKDHPTGNIALQIYKGIRDSRNVVVFITERFMRKLSSEGDDYCRAEFLAACRVRCVKNMIVCVLEKQMLDTSQWSVQLIAGEMYIDFSTPEARAENLSRLLELI